MTTSLIGKHVVFPTDHRPRVVKAPTLGQRPDVVAVEKGGLTSHEPLTAVLRYLVPEDQTPATKAAMEMLDQLERLTEQVRGLAVDALDQTKLPAGRDATVHLDGIKYSLAQAAAMTTAFASSMTAPEEDEADSPSP